MDTVNKVIKSAEAERHNSIALVDYVTIAPARARGAALKNGGAIVTGYVVLIRPIGAGRRLQAIAEYLDGEAKNYGATVRREIAHYARVTNRARAIIAAHDAFDALATNEGIGKLADVVTAEYPAAKEWVAAAEAAARAKREAEADEAAEAAKMPRIAAAAAKAE